MLIDSHMHVNYHNLGAEALVEEMDTFGIDKCWLLTWYLPPEQHVLRFAKGFDPLNFRTDGTHGGLTLPEILRTHRMFPGRFVPGYCPCPYEGNAADLFEAAWHYYGVRVCGEWSYRMLLDDPRALELFRRAGSLGAPVVLHLDVPYIPDKDGDLVYRETWYGGGADPLERTLKACPETIFIGHAPGFWRYISGDEATSHESYPSGPVTPSGRLHKLLDEYPNLWADLSAGSGLNAIRRDLEHGREFILKYADRILYGRDSAGNELQEFLGTLDLSQEVMEKIRWRNAARLVAVGEDVEG
jgi:predicted TIM-barrel fold metal-dependent hydrolase